MRRLRRVFIWRLRYWRARGKLVLAGLRFGDLHFGLTAKPIMGADDGPGDGGGDGGGGDGGDGGNRPEPKPKKDPPPDNKLGEAERLRKKAEKEAKEAREKAEELEGRDASDLEKAQREAEKAKREAEEAKDEAKKLKRGAWVRAAANDAGAIDAEAVEALVNLDDAENAETATQLVKELADKKPALFGQRPDGGDGSKPKGFGTPAGGTPAGNGAEGALPGIGEDGKVDGEEVRSTIGKGMLDAIRGRGSMGAPAGGDEDDD